jgi:Mg/Co/Ni transporter MgtE
MEREEAIEVVKKNYPYINDSISQFETALRTLIPELAESEDERTWIINYLSNRILNSPIIAEKENLKKAIAWLEKQGEQKPAWSEEDEKLVKNLISTLSNLYARNLIEKKTKEKYTNLLKSLKDRVQPQSQWKPSEEQIKALERAMRYCPETETLKDAIYILEQLKKLREE